MGKEIQVRIVLRHNTTAGWAEVEEKEVLRKGEIGLEFNQSSNIPKMKIGDGVKPWKGLPYFSADLPETFNWGLLKGTLFEGETEKIEEGSFAGLTKPAYKDNADISVINKNFDILKTNIEEIQNKTLSIESTISGIDEAKVDKVSGKGLSTNDYTTDEKNKLAGIATGATNVIVDSALSSTSTNAIQNKVVANMKNEIDNALEGKLDINDNAATATKATQDSAGQQINTTYIKGLSINGKTITYTKGDGTTGTITTQDNNTTYSAGTGLSLSGTTFNHSNSVTAATAQGDASKTLTFGDTFTIPTITYDAQGHITGKGATTMTMPVGPVAKEGNPVSEIGIAGAGFSVETIFEPKQEGSGDPSPDNIRPISGRTDATLTRCGVNIFPPGEEKTGTMNGITFVSDGNGKYTLNGTSTGSAGFVINLVKPVRIPDAYVGYFHMLNSVANGNFAVAFFENGTSITFSSATIINRIRSIDGEFGSLLRGRTIDAVQLYVNGSGRVFDNFTLAPMLLQTGTLTDYKPYTGDTYTADFGQTVYGGTMDWTTGVLTVDTAVRVFDGTENWSIGDGLYFMLHNVIGGYSGTDAIMCSHFKGVKTGEFAVNMAMIDADGTLRLRNDNSFGNPITMSITDWKSYLSAQHAAGTPVQVCYKLATPTTIQLTPQDLRMLEGTNTVYSDGTTNYVIFNSGASSLGKAYELFFKKTDTISLTGSVTGSGTFDGSGNLSITTTTNHTHSYLPLSGGTITGGLYIKNNSTYPNIIFRSSSYTSDTGVIYNRVLASSTTSHFLFRQYSRSSTDYSFLSNYEDFYLPIVDANRASSGYYNILTTKYAVTIPQGGTGATTASGARTNLEVPSKTGDGASGTWGISVSGNAATATLASYALKMQTYKQGSTTETYGTSYPLYAQWESSNVLKLKCDNYTVKTDTATKLATARTLTIGNTGKTFDGSGNVSWSLSEIGAAATSHGTHVTDSTVQAFNRDTIGTSPNFDNPGVNGFFEVRITSETSGETGTKPFNSFGTFLNLRTPDHIAMLQLAARTGGELMFRAKQAAGVTMSGVAWKTLLSSSNYTSYTVSKTGSGASGTWGISISGNAATATQLATARTIQINLGSTSSASFNGTANITPGVTGTLAVANGGTGATSKSGARTNLGITSGTTLPSSGSSGDIFFLY